MPRRCGLNLTAGQKRRMDGKLLRRKMRLRASKITGGSFVPEGWSPSDWRKLIVKASIENKYRETA